MSLYMPKKLIISPAQALLLLIDHYKDDSEKVAELKKYYLVGVKATALGIGEKNHFKQDPYDLAKFHFYLNDKILSPYEISLEKNTINNDMSRRYFETHLAYETMRHQIDHMSMATLIQHEALLTDKLKKGATAEFKDIEDCERVFSGQIREDDSDTFKEYATYISKIEKAELFNEFTEEQRQKIILLVKCSFLGVANAKARGAELPLPRVYNHGLYSEGWKGKELVAEQRSTTNQHMGLLKGHMPIAADDIATSTTPAPPMKPSDQATYSTEGSARWVETSFAQLVHPFSNAISGTMLCQLRNLVEQKNSTEVTSIISSAQDLEQYAQLFISALLYGSGGHTLLEFTYPLQLEDVRSEFTDIEGFDAINLESIFLTHNATAFDAALDSAIIYNKFILTKQRLNQDVNALSRSYDQPAIASAITELTQKKESYVARSQSGLFFEHRMAIKKATLITPEIEKIIAALNEGNVEKSFDLSKNLMDELNQKFGTKGFFGGVKKSYQVACEVHKIVKNLHEQTVPIHNIGKVNSDMKDEIKRLKKQESAPTTEANNTITRG